MKTGLHANTLEQSTVHILANFLNQGFCLPLAQTVLDVQAAKHLILTGQTFGEDFLTLPS
jgi:hypothetical protein